MQDPLTFGDMGSVRHGSFSNPTGPPPPYESVITDSAAHNVLPAPPQATVAAPGSTYTAGDAAQNAAAANGSSGGAGPAYSSDFEISVADPVKQGEGVSAFVSYKASRTETGLGQ